MSQIFAVAGIRNALAYATHTFFQKQGFLYVHTLIITISDCEGAGEMFQVSTMTSEADKLEKELIKNPPPSAADIEAAKLLVKEKGEVVAQLKSDKARKEDILASVAELKIAKENLAKLEERSKLKPGIPIKDWKIDYTQDFFARQAFLTVSGELQVESYAYALSRIYTSGQTLELKCENTHTSRHLAESGWWSLK
nr:asparagine--trna ligase, cytoplasmic 3 [Quercus suber]